MAANADSFLPIIKRLDSKISALYKEISDHEAEIKLLKIKIQAKEEERETIKKEMGRQLDRDIKVEVIKTRV